LFKSPVAYLKSFLTRDIETKSISLIDPLAFELFGAVTTTAGPSITAATAIRVPAVYSAIALISGAIGSLPAKVFETADSGKRTSKNHPAYRLVHDEANPWTSAGQLRAKLTIDALLYDHGYAVAVRVNGVVKEFVRLDPRTVTIKTDAATGEPFYEVQNATGKRTYRFEDILHISAPLDVAPIKAGREAIALASILERCASQLFANGARPSGVLTKEAKAGSSADNGASVITNIKKAWRAWLANSNGDPLILDNGWTYNQATMTSTDAQFAEMRVEQTNEIARVFRVPPHLLFELSRATWSNAEEMFQSFLTLTLRSWLDAWEWAYARCLLTADERAAGYFVEFVIDDLVTANTETRAETYAKYRAMGVLTANEVRAGLNREPLDGGDELSNPNITPGRSAANDSKYETVSDLPRKAAA